MSTAPRSILQELNEISVRRDHKLIIESRGSNIVASAINLIALIKEHYSPEDALELERKFISAIRTADTVKFKKGVKKLHEGKNLLK